MDLYPKEFIQYLVHFHGDRDYFECHEILEEYWKQTDFGNKDSIWVGFIQLAVSNYHHRRGNFEGAKKTMKKALSIFLSKEPSIIKLGLDSQSLLVILYERLAIIEQNKAYKSINLPINDHSLLNQCKFICEQSKYIWGNNSDLTKLHILHRHKLRDRAGVIQERNSAKQIKKTRRLASP
jgi:uncharacterized protein